MNGIQKIHIPLITARLNHLISGTDNGCIIVTAVPIGHHCTFEAPFITQDIRQKPLAFSCMLPVDEVI